MTFPLDPAKDPDRYDLARDADRHDLARQSAVRPEPVGRLDPAKDPDRYDPARDAQASGFDNAQNPGRSHAGDAGYDGTGQGQTLTGLLGDGAQEQKREGLAWLFGLLAVIGFLVLVSLLLRLGH